MNRRLVLKPGLGVGALVGGGALARYALLSPLQSAELASVPRRRV